VKDKRQFRSFVVCVCSWGVARTSRRIDDATHIASSDILHNPFGVQPSNLIKCLPKFASLIDINLASLLCICLPKLFANLVSLNSLDEDPTLGGEICGTVKTEIGCEGDLIWMEEMIMWIVSEVDRSTLPVDFERVGFVRKA
jgi:hypothetical protein